MAGHSTLHPVLRLLLQNTFQKINFYKNKKHILCFVIYLSDFNFSRSDSACLFFFFCDTVMLHILTVLQTMACDFGENVGVNQLDGFFQMCIKQQIKKAERQNTSFIFIIIIFLTYSQKSSPSQPLVFYGLLRSRLLNSQVHQDKISSKLKKPLPEPFTFSEFHLGNFSWKMLV